MEESAKLYRLTFTICQRSSKTLYSWRKTIDDKYLKKTLVSEKGFFESRHNSSHRIKNPSTIVDLFIDLEWPVFTFCMSKTAHACFSKLTETSVVYSCLLVHTFLIQTNFAFSKSLQSLVKAQIM